jgi:catechol 1,2-dioxygenase
MKDEEVVMKAEAQASRRRFLLAGLAALPLVGCEALAENCRPTERGAGGPFYRRGAPWRARLAEANEPGEPLVISGRVVAAGTCQPLKGAIVDVWQANAAGFYDNQLSGERAAGANGFRLRGQMKTDDEGRYQFETVLPGNYGDAGVQRARHIHYIVSFPGYAPLTTECYFEGDEHNRTDPLVRQSLVVALSSFAHPQERRKYLKGTFDIVLGKTG